MNTVMIALGSNIEPRSQYLNDAIQLLAEHENIKVVNQSSIYETDPIGYEDQSPFLNMVIQIKTELIPMDLLSYCQKVEIALGREREIRWGPRTVDLDILVYNQKSVHNEHLTIPHPRMLERAFVLIPLSEIGEDVEINNHTVQFYIDKLSDKDQKGVKKWRHKDGD
jgi:2-amino-4-hydroxy-6-hydroxymethyldihydropteridine diphosphokinase